MPKSEAEWRHIASDFKNQWDFDNCLGAMDGKHILITKPPNSGSYYYNYKGSFSIVLFGIVNANYEFIYVHSGTNGRVSDGDILRHTDFFRALENNELQIPAHRCPPLIDYELPYVFLGDEAFPLMENLMKPYSNHSAGHDEHIFNYRLSRARRVVENTFGILASRFRVFLQPININVKHIDWIVMASCVLHNYLRRKSSTYYTSANHLDWEDIENGNVVQGQWRQVGELVALQKSSFVAHRAAKSIRDQFKNYYNNEGRVSFQETMINNR